MNRLARPVSFTMEPDVVTLWARLTFGASGAVTLDTANSKGICAITLSTFTFTGTTANASPTISAVNTFKNLYPGMTVQDAGPTNVNRTISSMNAGASTITMSGNATGTNTGLTASGGVYTVQFGAQAAVRLDTYNKLLFMDAQWDESSTQGNASTLALGPGNPVICLVGNNITTRTIPPTTASVLTDATVNIAFGTGSGTSFTVSSPQNGEVLRLAFAFCRSGAI